MDRLAETIDELRDQVIVMQAHGFDVTEDDLIKDTLKRGFQAIVDEQADGSYFTVRWDSDFHNLQVLNFDDSIMGEAKPNAKDYMEQFKQDSDSVWDNLNDAAIAALGR